MHPHTEIELKLRFDPSYVKLLDRHPWIIEHTKGAACQQHLISTYFDTAKQALWKRGFVLRIRQYNDQYWQTLKGNSAEIKNGLHTNQEWEQEVTSDKPDLALLPQPLHQELVTFIADETLLPLFVTDFQRTAWNLFFPDGTQVELARDVGVIRAAQAADSICELELELKAGTPATLYLIADVLKGFIPLTEEMRSKGARGYGLLS